MEGSLTQRIISVDFLTPSYRIVGKVSVANTGLIGVLNNPNTSFIEVLDAKLARLHMPTKLVDHFELIRLTKPQVFAACLKRREDIGPQALARGGYAHISEFEVRFGTPTYEVDGVIEWTGRFDFSAIMVEGTRDFVPLYDAVISAVLIPAVKIDSPAILFNRQHVDFLGLAKQRNPN